MKIKSYASLVVVIGTLCLVFILILALRSSNSLLPTTDFTALNNTKRSHQTIPIGGPFNLIDHHGHPRTDIDFKGKIMVVYFGYSFCPDVCPAALYHISQALNELGAKAKEIQPLFITVDPKRDTVQNLALYMENFNPQFLALTGTPEAITNVSKAYRVYAQKAPSSKASADEKSTDYLIDHSSIAYVMDRQGRFITSFNHETDAAKIKEILKDCL